MSKPKSLNLENLDKHLENCLKKDYLLREQYILLSKATYEELKRLLSGSPEQDEMNE